MGATVLLLGAVRLVWYGLYGKACMVRLLWYGSYGMAFMIHLVWYGMFGSASQDFPCCPVYF